MNKTVEKCGNIGWHRCSTGFCGIVALQFIYESK